MISPTPLRLLRRIIPVLAVICLSLSSHAIRVFFDYRIFNLPGEGPYIELITSFDGQSMKTAPNAAGAITARGELTVVIYEADYDFEMDTVVTFRKIVAESNPTETGYTAADFMSLERLMVPNGRYTLELTATDLNDPSSKPQVYVQKLAINNPSEGIFTSELEFISAYTPSGKEETAFSKAGMEMIPYISGYFPSSLNQLVFYAEVYNTDQVFGAGNPFVTSVCIVDGFNREREDCKRMKREKSAAVVPVFQTLDIRDLPTGEYKLRVEVRDRNNLVVATTERVFSRSLISESDASAQADSSSSRVIMLDGAMLDASFAGQYTDRDSLYDLLLAHHPIARNVERNTIDFQLAGADLRMLQSFFYTFWYRRDPGNPEAAWRAYEKQLNEVNAIFGTRIKKGWQSDRGRVYLQYGPPSTRVVRMHDPDYWPFEIWHYYETNTGLRDRRFLFYNTSLDTDLELLHSDAPGEVVNYDWKNLVRSRRMNDPATTNRLGTNQAADPYSGDELEDLWYNPH